MGVFLRIKDRKKGKMLYLVEGVYSPSSKNVKQVVLREIGLLHELQKIYNDPIAHFKDVAKKLSLEHAAQHKEDIAAPIPREEIRKNVGYFPISRLYDLFNFNDLFTFFKVAEKHKFQFDLQSLFKFLIYSQIIHPNSKIKEYTNKDMFFEDFNFSDDQMYDGISFIGKHSEYFLETIQNELMNKFNLKTDNTYYDGTNFYFEIDRETDFLRRGPEKNHRHDPIIGFGLLMDNNGIPISYTTYPGNENEQPQMHKALNKLKKKLDIVGKTIITADKGLNSGDNMYKAVKNGDGYVFGQKVRGLDDVMTTWILDDSFYKDVITPDGEITHRIKSTIGDFKVNITSEFNGQKAAIHLKQKRVVFWSKDYADKSKHEREKLIAKACDLINCPSQYKKTSVGNAAAYIKEIRYDKDGNIDERKSSLELDEERIKQESILDGYYMIVTSETHLKDEEIIKIYRGLWEIEESFSIMKGVLDIRPMYAKVIEGVHSQILISFFALTLLRILQKQILKDKELTAEQLNEIEKVNKRKRVHKIRIEKIGEIPVTKIVEFMREFNALKINDSYFIQKYNDLTPIFEKKYDLKLDKFQMTNKDIEKIFNRVKTAQDKI